MIVSEEAIAKGIRRIVAVTGAEAQKVSRSIMVGRERRESVMSSQKMEKVGELPSSIFTLPRVGERRVVSLPALCVHAGSRGCTTPNTPGNERRLPHQTVACAHRGIIHFMLPASPTHPSFHRQQSIF